MRNLPKALNTPILILLGFVLVVTVLFSIPQVRVYVRETLLPESREILAKVDGDLTGEGDQVSVIKVKTRSDLIVEVYSQNATRPNETALRARIVLPERRDGHFQLRGQPTNLALIDVNGDGVQEIAVPTYDENLIPRLHIYRYDPIGQVFILAGPELLPNPGSFQPTPSPNESQ